MPPSTRSSGSKSHIGLWVTGLLLLPVIYLFSVSPLYVFTSPSKKGIVNAGMLRPFYGEARWFKRYRVAYDWVASRRSLERTMYHYHCWCEAKLRPLAESLKPKPSTRKVVK